MMHCHKNLKYLNVCPGKLIPKFVTGFKILRRQGDELTPHLGVVLSDSYGSDD